MTLPWADLPFLLALARLGTLSEVARALKVDRTTISRRIAQLQDALEEPLFDRFDGRFTLTPYGRRVFAAAEGAEQELLFLERPVAEGRHEYGGRIRVSMSEHLLMTLAACFHGFMQAYPNIRLELSATDRHVDLKHFEADVALRIGGAIHGDFYVEKLGRPIFALYRGRNYPDSELRYIARPGELDVPDSVLKHAPRAELGISVDGLVSTRELIAHGFGIGILPRYFGDRDPRVERCADALPGRGAALSVVTRSEQRRLYRIKTFVDHVRQHMAGLAGFDPV